MIPRSKIIPVPDKDKEVKPSKPVESIRKKSPMLPARKP